MNARIYLYAVIAMLWVFSFSVHAEELVLPTATANVSDDFNDGDFDGWTVDSVGGWEVKDGVMQISKPNEYKWENWLTYYAKYDAGEINGDFTLSLDIGFNIDAYTREEVFLYYPDPNTVAGTDSMLDFWEVYRRNFAFGIMKDLNNSLLATASGDWGRRNGIFRSWEDPDSLGNIISECLYYPYPGQGVTQDIHDKRAWKISRSGDVITVWADERVFCQTTDDNSTEPVTSGWVVAGSRGNVGIAFDNVNLSSSAVPPPTWDGPEVLKNADFLFEEGEGYLITSQDGKYIGVAEGATTGDNRFGYWVDDGVENGNKSYAFNCGDVNFHGVEYGPKTTFEGWFKFFPPHLVNDRNLLYRGGEYIHAYRSYYIIHTMVRNKGWFRNRGGLMLICDDDGENPALLFHIDRSHQHDYCIAAGNIEYGQWHHVSWVRNGEEHLFFLDGVKSQLYDWRPAWGPPHATVDTVNGKIIFKDDWLGPTTFENLLVTLGNTADHDFSIMFSRDDPLFLVDRFTIATEDPGPDEFSGSDHFSSRGSIKIDTVNCEANGQATVDVQYKADEFVSYLYFRLKFDPDKVEVVSIDRKPDPNSLWTWEVFKHGLYNELPPTPGLLEFAAIQYVPGRVMKTDYFSIVRITFRDISGTKQVVPLEIDFARAGSRFWYSSEGGIDPYTSENQGTSYFLLEPINGAMIVSEPGVTGVACDFNGDGRIDIADIIGLLLFLRDNPDDLRGDFNGDGSTGVADAIAMVHAQRDGTCPDAGVLLSSAIEDAYLLVTGRLDNLTVKDIRYIEKIMVQLDLTKEEEDAFRLALYGGATGSFLPRAFSLSQNVPNPFNPSTTISYDVPEEKGLVRVSLRVYNLRGQLVRILVDEVQEAGGYNVFWNGRNDNGSQVASGIYIYRMQAGDFVQTRKMVLLK